MTLAEQDAYIATAPCGCTYAISTHITDEMAKDTRHGAVVERVSADEGRRRFVGECQHEPKWGGMP